MHHRTPYKPTARRGPVPPTSTRLQVKREGRDITQSIPKPMVLVDTREQVPMQLARFSNWIAGETIATLPTGDYSIQGMEDLVCLERKSLNDAVNTVTHGRERFIRQLERMVAFRHRAIVIEATYEDLKTPYTFPGVDHVKSHPNGICGSYDAIEARFGIPIIYTSQNRDLADEKAASWLSKVFTYWWLESSGLGRELRDGDL